jgi:hypothetical protein
MEVVEMRIARVCCLMLFVAFLAVAVVGCGSSRSASSDEASHAQAVHSDDGAVDAEVMAALAELPEEDRLAAEAQKYCAVMMESRLGSMGAPFKVMVEGQPVFLCCEGCKDNALANPQETLANVKKLTEGNRRQDRN